MARSYNHIDVLYYVKIQINGSCVACEGGKCNVRPRLDKGAAFEGVVFAARARHPYSSSL